MTPITSRESTRIEGPILDPTLCLFELSGLVEVVAKLSGLPQVVAKSARRQLLRELGENERRLRILLGHWVSGCEPAVVMEGPFVVGLCDADVLLGMKTFVLRYDEITRVLPGKP